MVEWRSNYKWFGFQTSFKIWLFEFKFWMVHKQDGLCFIEYFLTVWDYSYSYGAIHSKITVTILTHGFGIWMFRIQSPVVFRSQYLSKLIQWKLLFRCIWMPVQFFNCCTKKVQYSNGIWLSDHSSTKQLLTILIPD